MDEYRGFQLGDEFHWSYVNINKLFSISLSDFHDVQLRHEISLFGADFDFDIDFDYQVEVEVR